MTEPRDHLSDAFEELRSEIRALAGAPAVVGLRARAARQLRVRRATTAVLAMAAVAAIALGGNILLRPTAGPPVPPAGSPSSTGIPAPATPPVTPSPRPSPRPSEPFDDPIAQVDWQNATIDIPPREVGSGDEPLRGCPEGRVQFVPDPDSGPELTARGPQDSFPAVRFQAGRVAYGDLTGDGRAEAVLVASCAISEEGLASGHGDQLLVVTRADDGTLSGLAWTGVLDAHYHSVWVADGRLLVDAAPFTSSAFPDRAGLALSYQWDGTSFVGWEPASEYPPIVALDLTDFGPPVRPGPAIAAELGCPDEEVRFRTSIDVMEWPWLGSTSTSDSYALARLNESQPHLLDLDRTGDRLLVVALACRRLDGTSPIGLAVFARAGDGWQGISVLLPPAAGRAPSHWSLAGDRFLISWEAAGEPATGSTAYRWTGTVFAPLPPGE